MPDFWWKCPIFICRLVKCPGYKADSCIHSLHRESFQQLSQVARNFLNRNTHINMPQLKTKKTVPHGKNSVWSVNCCRTVGYDQGQGSWLCQAWQSIQEKTEIDGWLLYRGVLNVLFPQRRFFKQTTFSLRGFCCTSRWWRDESMLGKLPWEKFLSPEVRAGVLLP